MDNKNPTRLEIHNVVGTVKRSGKTVFMEIYTGGVTLELHFGDPGQLMTWCLLMIQEMAKVFPEHEASKMWNDPNFR